jgi:hypothetical protein
LGFNTLGSLAYAYDLAGRKVQAGGSFARTGLPQPVSATAYNVANQLTQWGTATPTYDANGNTLSDGANTYVWDARNHLSSMNTGGVSFQYDSFGRRASKTILAATTNFLYDGLNPVQEISGGVPTANVLTGLLVDEFFSRTDSSGSSSVLADALGSTLALVNSSGTLQAQYTYEPFGTRRSRVLPRTHPNTLAATTTAPGFITTARATVTRCCLASLARTQSASPGASISTHTWVTIRFNIRIRLVRATADQTPWSILIPIPIPIPNPNPTDRPLRLRPHHPPMSLQRIRQQRTRPSIQMSFGQMPPQKFVGASGLCALWRSGMIISMLLGWEKGMSLDLEVV